MPLYTISIKFKTLMEVKSIHQLLFPYYLLHSKPYRHSVVQLFVLSCPPGPPRPREVVPPLSLHTTPVLLQLLLSTVFTGRPLQVPELSPGAPDQGGSLPDHGLGVPHLVSHVPDGQPHPPHGRVVHLNFKELLCQQSCAINNQLWHPKPPTETQNMYPQWGHLGCTSLFLHAITTIVFQKPKIPSPFPTF